MTEHAPRAIDRRTLGVRFLQLATLLAVPREAFSQAPRGPFEVVSQHQVMVPMRDGVRLATEVYLPAKGGKPLPGRFPAILERTPYGRISRGSNRGADAPSVLASHGYVVVFQDKRGRGQSEGEYVKYLTDADDGFDCCSWLVKQPWSNGQIGTMGTSYDAHTQGAAASMDAPGIKAMILDSGAFANAYQDGIRQGGAFELKQVTWAFRQMQNAPGVADDPELLAKIKAVDLAAWFRRMPWSRGNSPLSLAPEYEDYVFDQWERGAFDDFWKQPGIYAEGYYDRWSKAAMVWVSSWYDAYSRSTTDNYSALAKMDKGPMQLIMGPWTHGANARTYSGDIDFGPQSTLAGNLAPDFLALKLRWFDHHLKGLDNGVGAEPKVRLFVMGGGSGRKTAEGRMDHGGRWRDDVSWPPSGMRLTPFYLHADGGLRRETPPAGDHSRTYRYDPRDPVPSIGGTITSGEPLMVGGGFDQHETA
ncbi:MAG TPA: CocE/NonD family hydrolase, partial [Phenylobacterium sp.]|nr:CocE/NonD family hydrolase [Phenylobacterium sp.]